MININETFISIKNKTDVDIIGDYCQFQNEQIINLFLVIAFCYLLILIFNYIKSDYFNTLKNYFILGYIHLSGVFGLYILIISLIKKSILLSNHIIILQKFIIIIFIIFIGYYVWKYREKLISLIRSI